MRRVVVTGMGAISPLGLDAKENWASLMVGKSGISPITFFDASQYPCKIAGQINAYRPEKYFPVKELKKIDRFIQFSLIAAEEAMTDAGLDSKHLNPERVGACIGVGIGGLPNIEEECEEILNRGPKRVSPFFIPKVISNLAAGHISMKYNLKGPNTCITSACSSSAHAIGESFRTIQRAEVDAMIAGGAEAVICKVGVAGFCAMRALSSKNEEPTKASRPFDKDRDGFVMGEGSAVVILEELEHAKQRGAPILAEILGYGSNSDAYHMTQPSPEGAGGARCMELALADAKLSADAVDYINTHGTSTPIGDTMETIAIKRVFGRHAYKLCASSTKSMTGHLLGAAGALEAMYCVQAILNKVAPPTINLENPSPECDLNYVPKQPQPRPISVALSNSFGFGGTNASLIFKRFE